MNQQDREFIIKTIRDEVPAIVKAELSLALKEEIPKIVKAELVATNKAIDDLAIITAKGFMRVDEEFNKVWICLKDLNTKVDSIDNRLITVEKKVDRFGSNYVRDTTHHELDKRVKKLELVRV